MGIPLMFRQVKIDVKDKDGKTRRIPIMVFEYPGTVQQLRAEAAREIASRVSLRDAGNGTLTIAPDIKRSLYDGSEVVDGETIDDVAEDKAEDIDEGAVETSVKKEDDDLSSEVAILYKRMRFTPARQRMLEDKHGGDLAAVLEELRDQSPADFNPSPGEPGEDQDAETETEEPAAEVEDDDDDDLFD